MKRTKKNPIPEKSAALITKFFKTSKTFESIKLSNDSLNENQDVEEETKDQLNIELDKV